MCRSLTSSTAIAALVWLVLALISAFAAEEDESAADAAASAALTNARILDVQARVLDIEGLAGGIAAQSKDVSGKVEDLQAAMRDLNAKETELEIRIELSADVLFDFDKSEIRNDAAEELAKAATIIRGYPGANVRVIGHTDSTGSDAVNQPLSIQRAAAVRAHHDVVAVQFAGQPGDHVRRMADLGVHDRLHARRVEPGACLAQRLFAFLAVVVGDLPVADELADVASQGRLHVDQVHLDLIGHRLLGTLGNQVVDRTQGTFRSVDRNQYPLHGVFFLARRRATAPDNWRFPLGDYPLLTGGASGCRSASPPFAATRRLADAIRPACSGCSRRTSRARRSASAQRCHWRAVPRQLPRATAPDRRPR